MSCSVSGRCLDADGPAVGVGAVGGCVNGQVDEYGAPATVDELEIKGVPEQTGRLGGAVGVVGAAAALSDNVVGHVVTQPAALRTFIV